MGMAYQPTGTGRSNYRGELIVRRTGSNPIRYRPSGRRRFKDSDHVVSSIIAAMVLLSAFSVLLWFIFIGPAG